MERKKEFEDKKERFIKKPVIIALNTDKKM